MTDLEFVKEGRGHLDDAGNPLDGWGRPLHYRVEPGGYVLYSYGKDGQPGGVGLASDLYAGDVVTEAILPTLWQFTTMPDTWGIRLTCFLAGVVAFPLFLLQTRGQKGNRPSLRKILLANAVTAFFAVLTAVVIAVLHLPTGH